MKKRRVSVEAFVKSPKVMRKCAKSWTEVCLVWFGGSKAWRLEAVSRKEMCGSRRATTVSECRVPSPTTASCSRVEVTSNWGKLLTHFLFNFDMSNELFSDCFSIHKMCVMESTISPVKATQKRMNIVCFWLTTAHTV